MTEELIYHTHFAEYRGANADAVIEAMFKDSSRVTEWSKEQWWENQIKFLGGRTVPALDAEGASQAMLDAMIDVNLLTEGPKPEKAVSARVNSAEGGHRGR